MMVSVLWLGPPDVSSWISAKHWNELMVVMTRMYRVVGMMAGHLIFQNALEIGRAVHLGRFHDGLIDVAQGRDVQHDGLAHRGGEQDEDDAAQGVPLVAQPVDVLINECRRLLPR